MRSGEFAAKLFSNIRIITMYVVDQRQIKIGKEAAFGETTGKADHQTKVWTSKVLSQNAPSRKGIFQHHALEQGERMVKFVWQQQEKEWKKKMFVENRT